MGRYYYRSHTVCDSLKKLSIFEINRYGILRNPWWDGIHWSINGRKTGSIDLWHHKSDKSDCLELKYEIKSYETEQVKSYDYNVNLVTTKCNYGGSRYWFICPCTVKGVYCGRRVGILYFMGDYFACRNCQRLTYASRNINSIYRTNMLLRFLELDRKVELLEQKIKRRTYAGRPTRKQQRINRMYSKLNPMRELAEMLI